MNRFSHLTVSIVRTLACTALIAALVVPASAQDDMDSDTLLTGAMWEAFNANLVSAVHSGHEGQMQGALTQIAMYGDYMDFPELTVFEVMRVYRDYEDTQMRRLAVVALGNMGSHWAIEFLDMLTEYEEDTAIQSTMRAVVKAGRTD